MGLISFLCKGVLTWQLLVWYYLRLMILEFATALGICHYPICASCIDMKCHNSCICSQSRIITECSNCTHDLFFYDSLEGVRHPTLIQTLIQILVVTHHMERLCTNGSFKLSIDSNEQYWHKGLWNSRQTNIKNAVYSCPQ